MADKGEEDDPPEDHPEEEVPLQVPQEEDNKQGEPPLKDLDYPDDAVEGFGSEQPHYQWDELNDEEAPSFWANALRTLDGGSCSSGFQDGATAYVNCNACRDIREHKPCTCRLASAKTGGQPPVYDHHAHKCMGARPKRSHESNQTLSGYWEVDGTKAHCLLDSGCEGIMISPNFTHAMGLVTKKLENPVALQLACVGSKLTISYGAMSTITFGNQCIEEYFDVANINYYDVILGTPFLRRHGITLDFASPGSIWIGTYTVPRNIPSTQVEENTAVPQQPCPKPPE